jgi:hypothetical protein
MSSEIVAAQKKFPFYVNAKNAFVAQSLLSIGGQISVGFEDDEENFYRWASVKGFEVVILLDENALTVLIEENNSLHPECLFILFSLDNIDGNVMFEQIKQAILTGVEHYEKVRPDKQLSLF